MRNIFNYLSFKRESEWLQSETANIFLTACAPAFITLIGVIIQLIHAPSLKNIYGLLGNELFYNSLQLSLIFCVTFVLFRFRKKILLSKKSIERLKNYLVESAIIRDKGKEQISLVLKEINRLTKLFFYAWLAIWCFFLLYYAENLCASIIMPSPSCREMVFLETKSFWDDTLNYASSTAMFGVFVLLNSVVVSFNSKRSIAKNGLEFSIALAVLFGLLAVVPSFLLFGLCEQKYYELQFYISFVLSIYSVLAFVLMLGKFNSVYLRIPRFIYYGLYLYAILQAFQFLIMSRAELDYFCIPEEIAHYIEVVGIINQYATLIGKFCLSILLLKIVGDFKFLFYLVKDNLELSNSEYEKETFISYMKS